LCQFAILILGGVEPAEIKFRVLPPVVDDGYEFLLMENLNDRFSAVASVVGAVKIDKRVFPTRQVGVCGKNDGSYFAVGAEEFSCGEE